MNYNWEIKKTSKDDLNHIINEFKLPESIAIIMAQRGILDRNISRNFFYPDLDKLHDPFLMLGMEKAVNYIEELIQNKKLFYYLEIMMLMVQLEHRQCTYFSNPLA